MQKLVQLFSKYRIQILFVFLQLIAFSWLIQTNNFQRASFFNASNIISANLNEKSVAVLKFADLGNENERLNDLIVYYKEKDSLAFIRKADSTYSFEMDTLKYLKKWKYYPAQIVNKSARLIDNYLTIDRGETSGIKRDMGVINNENVVGIIKQTSDQYAILIPLINSQLSLGAKLKKSNHSGSVYWDKKDIQTATLRDIPAYAKIQIGDTVVTTGYSSYFPDGIKIGTIKEFDLSPAANAYEITISIFTDYNSINSVQVVTNILFEEQKVLEKGVYTNE